MRKLLLALLFVGCTKPTPPPPAEAAAPLATALPSLDDAKPLVENGCYSCHSPEMIAQQRLTPAQWQKTVTKMIGWGANLEEKDAPAVVAYLSATYGADAGAWEPLFFDASAAEAEVLQVPDGVYANGKVEAGHALYIDRCSGCHGADARGHIGVNLVDRPVLYRAEEIARTVRKGRGKMPPAKITDPEVADVLAYLRTLR